MKFFIIGDSWGQGEYPLTPNDDLSSIPNTGLDFYLTQLGHTVKNNSKGGACNFGQLRHAYWTLKDSVDCDYDYIVWFHTEPVRDIVEHVIDDPVDGPIQYPEFSSIKDINQAMQYINECNYRYAQDIIYQEFQIPFIVIGGVGRVEESIDRFEFARYKIYSWTEELLNLEYRLPRNQMRWHRWHEVFSTFSYDRAQTLEELDAVSNFQQLLKKSPLFPDDMHVIRTEYEKLAHRLLEIVK